MTVLQTRIHSLPPQPTPFIGRHKEVAEITTLLAEPACRLLTLVGPGGIGKTRLAIEVAARNQPVFADGVAFISLQPISTAQSLPAALADAMQIPIAGPVDPAVQVLSYLRDKHLLVVMDNFEHLLAGSSLLSEIVAAAPKVKLLVTSREVLNLQEEWLYPLEGLDVPAHAQVEDIEHYSAVELFVQRARRRRRHFVLPAEQEAVVQICRLVEGMPLALELAAAWTKMLSCVEIATEIEHNLIFLNTGLRDMPERHRSMRAAFDHSWQLLSEGERAVFMRLAVFRGRVRRDAAAEVAGATLPILATLVDKSLVRYETDGRFHLHELLRQYAAEQLQALPDEMACVHERHCTYYCELLAAWGEAITGGGQREATADIAAELDNVRGAWQWALDHDKVDLIHRAAHTLARFYDIRSRYREGITVLEQTNHNLRDASPTRLAQSTRASVLVDLARLYIRVGRLVEARTALEESQSLHAELDLPPQSGQGTDPLLWLGVLALIEGKYAEAARLGEAGRQRNEVHHHTKNLRLAWYVLARAAELQGNYQDAWNYAQQAYAVAQTLQNRWSMADCLNELGNIACARGAYAEASRHYQAAYTLQAELNDPGGMAMTLNYLGKVAVRQGDYDTARRLYQRSFTMYQEIDDQGGLAVSLAGLGVTANAIGDYPTARQHFAQALQIATKSQLTTISIAILMDVGSLFLQTGQLGRGVELLAFVQQHPASDRETHERVQSLLNRYKPVCALDIFATAMERGQSGDLSTVVTRCQSELEAPTQQAEAASLQSTNQAQQLQQSLVEPLTERERQVLSLIADGLSNQQIAAELFLAVSTVKWYTTQIYGKLDVQNRTQAVARARELHLLA